MKTWKLRIVMMLVILASTGLALTAEMDNNHLAAWMRMGLGARALAMGGAGSASVDNVTASYWNPAALARMNNIEVDFMAAENMGADRRFYFGALGMKFKYGSVALYWINAGVTDIAGYDETGTYTGDFDNTESAYGLSYATPPWKVKFGFSAKVYNSEMEDSESGFGLDVGMLWDVNQYMAFSMMVRDAYAKIGEAEVPTQYVVGAAFYPFDGVTLTADMRKEKKSDQTEVGMGAEYWTTFGDDTEVDSKVSSISLEERTSWDTIMADTQGGLRVGVDDGSFTCGMGLRFRMFELNYAFLMAEDENTLEDSHRFELLLRF